MTSRIDIGGFILEVANGGADVRLTIAGTDTLVWSWPRISSQSFPTIGEELAQALATIDGTFYVVPRQGCRS